MKFLLIVHHNEEAFENMDKETQRQLLAESIELTHQLHAAGQYVHASPLQPEATRTIVRVRDGKPMVSGWSIHGNEGTTRWLFSGRCRKAGRGDQDCLTRTWRADRHCRSQTGDWHLWIVE